MLRLFLTLWLAITPAFAWAGSMSLLGAGKASAGGGTVVVCGSGWTGPTSGLTHCWPMDAAHVSGTTVSDVIGSDTGTAGSSVTAGTGPSGISNSARTFPGTTGNGIYLASNPLPGTAPFSVFFWINKDSDVGSGGDQRWLCWQAGATIQVLAANANNTGALTTNIVGGSDTSSVAGTVSSLAWHHIGFTWDGSTQTTYLDGSVLTMASGAVGDPCTADTYAIADRAAGDPRVWTGSMATVVVYNRAISSSEVTQLFGAF